MARVLQKSLLLGVLYVVATSVLYLSQINISEALTSLRWFTDDSHAYEQLAIAIQSDVDTRTIWLTRLLHNKPVALLDTFVISIYRALDIPFLFSLTNHSSPYESQWKIPMLHPIELPFFLVAVCVIIRGWRKRKPIYRMLFLGGMAGSLVLAGLFTPSIQSLKLFPLVLMIRICIAWGMLLFVSSKPWVKKFFS